MKKLRLKRIAMLVGAITCMISAIFTISYKNKHNTNQKNENNIPIKLANRESRDEIIKVADNALNVQKEERNAILQEMYEDIPDKKIKEYEDMPIEELKEDIDNLEEKYQVGQIFSKEDQNKVLFAYEKYGGMRTKNENNFDEVAYVWTTYYMGDTKTKHGVKIGYDGKLKTYVTASGGKYNTNVKVTVYSGKNKLKNAQWKTSHSAYGLIGTNGTSPSLGIVYNGSVKSDKYKKTFSFERTKNYTSLLPCYIKTWGTLIVKCDAGEFDLKTGIKSSWE